MSDLATPNGPYLRRLELAGDRIRDAVRRLKQRDRLWVLNAVLRDMLDEAPEADQAASSSPRRRSPSVS